MSISVSQFIPPPCPFPSGNHKFVFYICAKFLLMTIKVVSNLLILPKKKKKSALKKILYI